MVKIRETVETLVTSMTLLTSEVTALKTTSSNTSHNDSSVSDSVITIHQPRPDEDHKNPDNILEVNRREATLTGSSTSTTTGNGDKYAKEVARHCDTPTRLSFSDKVRRFSSRDDGKPDL